MFISPRVTLSRFFLPSQFEDISGGYRCNQQREVGPVTGRVFSEKRRIPAQHRPRQRPAAPRQPEGLQVPLSQQDLSLFQSDLFL